MYRVLGMLLALAIPLGGCDTLRTVSTISSGSIRNVTPKQVFELRTAYALARVPMVAYRSLPWCAEHAPPCQTPAIAIQVKKADSVAIGALQRLSAFSKSGDTINLSSAYAGAQAAIATAQQIIVTYNLKK